ncbi:MAG: hypothetical protein J6W58_06255 [Lachnospiraceae bacterium]|nr:hypothetical protein [Lachnospiraceae bacterium]MBP5745886.1 hypothetical protein [Lachnospiraceae bacterium]
MLTEQMTAAEVFDKYRSDIEKLIAYLPWLEEKSGKSKVSDIYNGDGLDQHSISFPVYDGTLLRFVKDAENTQFMDRNYVYVISRNRLKSAEEEVEFVKKQTMLKMDNIGGILSKYVMGGRTKAKLWSEAVDKGVFLAVVTRLKELYEIGLNGLSEQ